jgi:hypothetical protein fuD12_11002
MENKIKLIDIIENPLDLTEKIIIDMLENKDSKYINLMSAIITRAMYEEDPKFERDKVKFIVTGISKDSLIPMMSFQSLLKTESYKFDLIESRYIANVKESVVMFDDYAFDEHIKEKYKFDPYRVFDIDKRILDRLNIDSINLHSLRVRSIKFIYTAIMIFVKSKYVKDIRGLGKSLITSIDINEDMVHTYDKPYCAITAIHNFKIGLLRGKLYSFSAVRKVPSILYSMKIANQTITITDNITNYRMSINMDSGFSTDKCFCLQLGDDPNYNIIKPVYADMEYIANEMEKAYNIELEKYNKIDKNVIEKPVSNMRLKEALKNAMSIGEFNDVKIRNEFIWSLLSVALKGLYKPGAWTNLLTNNEFVYYHNLRCRIFVLNVSKAIHNDDVEIVYNIIEKLNASVISNHTDDEDKYKELFMMDLVEYVLDLKLDSNNDYLQVWKDLVGLNKALEFNSESEDSKAKTPVNYKIKDLVLRNYEVADAYVFNVILRNGIWELPIAEDDEGLMLTSINKYNAKFDTSNPNKIRPNIVNAVKNLLEYQSRKMLYRVLLNAIKYIHKYTGNIHLNALMYSDFINVYVDVNKVISEAGRLQLANKNDKSPQSFAAINSLIDVFRINERKCNNPDYIEIKNFMGRYVDMGETYYIIKDILFIYFCLLFSDRVGYDKNILLDGLTIGGLDAKFVNHSNDNIVKFSPLDDVGIEGRDRELKNYGYNPENIPFLLRYRKTLTSEHLKDFAKDVHYVDKKNIHNPLDKLEDLWVKQVCFDEMTFSRNNTDRKSTRRDRYLALMVELGEILKEDECYKYWKSSKHTLDDKEYREKAKEEFSDLLHFVMSIGIDIYDGGVNEMYEYYLKKNAINIERQNNKY